MSGALWHETRNVKGQATRLDIDDHGIDAMEYMIGASLYGFADSRLVRFDKRL